MKVSEGMKQTSPISPGDLIRWEERMWVVGTWPGSGTVTVTRLTDGHNRQISLYSLNREAERIPGIVTIENI